MIKLYSPQIPKRQLEKRKGIHSAMRLKIQKGMQRMDHWEHFLITKTEILEQIIWKPVKSSSLFFRSKPVKQFKEWLHSTDSSLSLKKKKSLKACYRCIVYDFYYLDNREDSIAAVTQVCNTQQLLKYQHSITCTYFGVLLNLLLDLLEGSLSPHVRSHQETP